MRRRIGNSIHKEEINDMTSMNGSATATPRSSSVQQQLPQGGEVVLQRSSSSSKNHTTTPISRKSASVDMEQESPLVTVCYDGNNGSDGTTSRSGIKLSPSSSNTLTTNANILSYTIVWSPLPPITWIIPFIGHTGICNSHGIASDFRGPYYVGDDGRMAFGPPTRYYKINISQNNITAEEWDNSIQDANELYRTRMHNLFCDNCHSHVAYALNQMPITVPLSCLGTIQKWDMIKIAILMFFRSSFLSWSAIVQQFLPFTILVTVIVIFNKIL